jgi:formylglycine-generating enzyme required for sulfatase activity
MKEENNIKTEVKTIASKTYRLPTEAEWDTIRSQRKLSQRS